jgi:zinc protease
MSTAFDQSRLSLYAIPFPGGDLDALEKATEAVIEDLITHGVGEAELKRAKTRLIADTIYAQDSQSSLARMYGSALATGSTVSDVAAWPDAIEAVTADSVRNAAKTWLDSRRAVSGHLIKDQAAS